MESHLIGVVDINSGINFSSVQFDYVTEMQAI